MRIKEDLVLVSHNGNFLIYNGEIHKGLLVNEYIFSLIKERNIFGVEKLSEEELSNLTSHGVIIKDEEFYNSLLKDRPDISNIEFKPKFSYIQITSQCNLRCEYCYNKENLTLNDSTKKETLLRMMDKLKSIGVKVLILTGGEPLARVDILELVKYAKSLGFYVQILTNGTMIKKKIEACNLVDGIITSIDTLDQKHNKRIGLNVVNLMNDLKSLPKEIKDKTVIRSVVGSEYPHDWKEVREFSSKNGFNFMHTVMMPYTEDDFKNLPSLEDLEEVPEEYRDKIGCSSCGASKGIIALDGYGNIYPCQAMIRNDMVLSNIFLKNWKEEFLKNRVAKKIHNRSVETADKCKDCNIKYICGGGCMAVSHDCYKDVNKVVGPLCEFKRAEAISELKGLMEFSGGLDV